MEHTSADAKSNERLTADRSDGDSENRVSAEQQIAAVAGADTDSASSAECLAEIKVTFMHLCNSWLLANIWLFKKLYLLYLSEKTVFFNFNTFVIMTLLLNIENSTIQHVTISLVGINFLLISCHCVAWWFNSSMLVSDHAVSGSTSVHCAAR